MTLGNGSLNHSDVTIGRSKFPVQQCQIRRLTDSACRPPARQRRASKATTLKRAENRVLSRSNPQPGLAGFPY